MNRRYRKTIIAGNWKMNLTPSDARAYARQFRPLIPRSKRCEVLLCVPYLDIPELQRAFRGSRVLIGAQNLHPEAAGAHTGEISAGMLVDAGVRCVIVGHSERRRDCGETDELVNRKLLAALEAGLLVILCVGETLEQRERGLTEDIISAQVRAGLYGVSREQLRRVVVAYEPVWAIGTGLAATAEQAQKVNAFIRARLRSLYDARGARAVSLLYGGSMNAANAAALLAQPDVDGGLIGGASLNPTEFAAIVEAASRDDAEASV